MAKLLRRAGAHLRAGTATVLCATTFYLELRTEKTQIIAYGCGCSRSPLIFRSICVCVYVCVLAWICVYVYVRV